MASRRSRSPAKAAPAPISADEPTPKPRVALPFAVVGVGGSAGGIEAFTQMLRALPADTGMAFVFVLHMARRHESILSEILARATPMPVSEVDRTMAIEPNRVYVISPGTDLALRDGVLVPSASGGAPGPARSIDHFLTSLAADLQHQAIGVVLSGSASDGALGLEQIKGEGGITFAQDATAQHDSMPTHAIATDCVDFVLSPAEIAAEIARIARHPLAVPRDELPAVLPELDLAAVLEILRNTSGVDFSHYKHNTLLRRIARRMVLKRIGEPVDYLDFLSHTPGEAEALYQDMLIGVTSFFRDGEMFDTLKTDIFPRLVADRARHDVTRMWALGCSTGEEAYSLAIAFTDFAETTGKHCPLQLFATDLNSKGIERARIGFYPRNIVDDVGDEALGRYFVEADGGYRVRRNIRDVCLFARHNILTEPPFSRIDFISCRNLLIYLGAEMQQRIIPILHYALRPDGYLWLGKSETIGAYRDLFELVDARYKIYRKKAGAALSLAGFVASARPRATGTEEGQHRQRAAAGAMPSRLNDAQKESERLLLLRYAPASVLVNSEFDVLQFRGDTGSYLAPSPGRASMNLVKMLREGLLVPVRNLMNQARKEGTPARKTGLRVRSNGGYRDASVEVVPIKDAAGATSSYLVMFEEAISADRAARIRRQKERLAEDRAERESGDMKQELAATREYLQSVIEQQEAANEELQSANEEVQSANEELQSINEELETSKEEVQSSNEELSTVNDELSNRNTELSQSNNDLLNLLSSVQMAIVMVGANLRIRRITPGAEKMLGLIAADIGRPIRDINLNIPVQDLDRHMAEVIDTVSPKEFEVTDRNGRWHLLRLRPYRTSDNRIDGVVVIMIDIDGVKRDQEILRHQTDLLHQAYEPIIMWEIGGKILYWNKAAEQIYGYSKEEALRRRNHELLGTLQSAPAIEESLERYGHWTGQLVQVTRDGRKIKVDSRMSLVRETDGRKLVIEANRAVEEGKG